MSDTQFDRAPGDSSALAGTEGKTLPDAGIHTIGLALAVALTAISFWVSNTSLLWAPGVLLGLAVLAELAFEHGRVLPAVYDGRTLDFRCRTDFIVADGLVLQVEAEEQLDFTHEALLRTCVWMGGFPLGLLLNFNVVDMAAEGISSVTCLRAENSPEDDVFGDVFEDPELNSRTR